jgi:diguanylate cyclase (GGDEF)-like protein/PAS domain S-box-containing protein
MKETWTLLSALLIANGLVALLLAIRSWMRRAQPGLGAFAGLMLAASIFSIFYSFEIASTHNAHKVFWLVMENLGTVFLGTAWLLFALGYTQRKWLSPLRLAMLLTIPILTLTWFANGLWPSLYYTSLTPLTATVGPVIVGRGPWYWVQMAYTYLLMFAGTVVLARDSRHLPRFYRGLMGILLLGACIPWAANAYYLLSPFLTPANRLTFDLTPLAFTLSGLLYSMGIFGLSLFDLMPVARTTIFEKIPELVVVLDAQGCIVDINATGRRWLNLPRDQAIGRNAREVFGNWPELLDEYIDVQELHEEVHISGNLPEYLDLTIMPLRDTRGRYAGRLVMGRDVTARRRIDDQVRLQMAALNAAANAIVITDTRGTCIWANSAFTQITGYKFEEIIGQKLSILKSGLQGEDFYKSLWLTILAGETWSGEIINRHKQGHLYIEEMTIAPVRNQEGHISNFIAVKQDITERKRIENNLQDAHQRLKVHVREIEALQEKLREQAIRDPLTELYNRRFLEETLEREVARAIRNRSDLCLAMIDVDYFKEFNDRYGHKAGDAILQSLGRMLGNTTRTADIACRYGGEEFIVVMPGASLAAARKRAEEWRIEFQNVVDAAPEYARSATISIGLASFPEHGGDSETLVDAADRALYQAKDAGRNRVKVLGEG